MMKSTKEKIAATIGPRYSSEEFARRGEEIYERDILPHLTAKDRGKFVVIDIETGAYEIDEEAVEASDRLEARVPNTQGWLRRVGYKHAFHHGGRARGDRERHP
jgi:hypothetical protein